MYIALYRKYRPKFFEDVLSQNHITKTLKNEIKLNRVSHAYVLTGPKGTGKTTCARIFSKAVNCENQIDGEPCCCCKTCIGLEDGSILDVIEIDGASNNSVSDVRDLKEGTNFGFTKNNGRSTNKCYYYFGNNRNSQNSTNNIVTLPKI